MSILTFVLRIGTHCCVHAQTEQLWQTIGLILSNHFLEHVRKLSGQKVGKFRGTKASKIPGRTNTF